MPHTCGKNRPLGREADMIPKEIFAGLQKSFVYDDNGAVWKKMS